jgi:CHASE3 domain sensor protein
MSPKHRKIISGLVVVSILTIVGGGVIFQSQLHADEVTRHNRIKFTTWTPIKGVIFLHFFWVA